MNLGAFAGGLARGWQAGSQLERDSEETKRLKADRERKDAQEGAFKALAELAESFVGPAVPKPAGDAAMAVQGVNVGSLSSAARGTAPGGAEGAEAAGPAQGVGGSAPADVPGPKTSEHRLGYALWRQPVLLNHPGFLKQAAQIFLKAGMSEGVAWLDRSAKAQQEGGITALRMLLQGDAAGAEQAFNRTGSVKLEPGSLKPAEGGKWQATVAGTGEARTFDPQAMLRSYLSPREFLDLARRERKDTEDEAHRGRTAAETERHHKATEGIQARNADLKLELARIRSERGADAATALQKNLGHLVKIGAAKDEAEAFTALRTTMGKPEADAILDMTKALMGRPGYLGKEGTKKAEADAREIVRSVRASAPAAPARAAVPKSSFKTPEDVRAAFRAGRLDRAAAIRELGAFGFAPQ